MRAAGPEGQTKAPGRAAGIDASCRAKVQPGPHESSAPSTPCGIMTAARTRLSLDVAKTRQSFIKHDFPASWAQNLTTFPVTPAGQCGQVAEFWPEKCG